MNKKLIIFAIIWLIIIGGIFWWWQSGKEEGKEIERPEKEGEAMEINEHIKIPPPIQKEELVFDPETGAEIVKDAILVVFKESVSEEIIDKKIESINGEIIGYNKKINKYDIRIKNNPSLEELKNIIKQLKEDPDIRIATVELPGSVFEQHKVPDSGNDPKMGSWNESKPSGKNWGLEVIHAPSAWDYNDFLEKVKIGIIDKGGFYRNHEDLEIPMTNINTPYGDFPEFPYYASGDKEENNMNHGTHIAGIIGAISNNKVGITGTVWNKELFGFNITDSFWGGSIVDGINYLINRGVKPINISLGWPLELGEETIKDYQESYNFSLRELAENHDFLIIQSAGNEKADAKEHALFNPLLKEEYKYLGKIIITVGAIENNNGNYKMAWFGIKEGREYASNYGDLVDVVAPGKEIYSTFWNEDVGIPWWKFWGKEAPFTVCFDWGNSSYGCGQGTSMAAPFVTGVAGLVWGANPNLTAEQVKEIIVNSADRPITYEGKEYKILNTKSSVKIAYELVGEAITGPQESLPEEEIKRGIPEIIEKGGPAALVPPSVMKEEPKKEPPKKEQEKEESEIITFLPSGKIAFVSDRDGSKEIYLFKAGETTPVNLTNNLVNDWNPTFSPDGSKIAFVSDRNGTNEIYIMDNDGTNVKRLTTGETPSWFLQGNKLVFGRSSPASEYGGPGGQFFTIGIGGENLKRIADHTGFWAGGPTVSPNGSQIAYLYGSLHGTYLTIVNIKGEELEHFSLSSNCSGTFIQLCNMPDAIHLSWSPVSNEMVFSDSSNDDIYIVNLSNKSINKLNFKGKNPTWDFSGKYIVFNSAEDNTKNISIFNRNTQEVKKIIISKEKSIEEPSWFSK